MRITINFSHFSKMSNIYRLRTMIFFPLSDRNVDDAIKSMFCYLKRKKSILLSIIRGD